MLRAVLVGYLTIASVIGPSLCCCAASSAGSMVRGWFGLDAVSCHGHSCCSISRPHAGSDRHENAHHASCHGKAGHSHRHDHRMAASSAERKANPRTDKLPRPRPCPCKQHGNDRSSVLPTSIVAVHSLLLLQAESNSLVSWHVDALVLEPIVASQIGFDDHPSSLQNGRDILRALHVLRC